MGFEILIRENSGGIHQEEGQLEMAKIENAFEIFFLFFWEFFNLARPPMRIRPPENLCISHLFRVRLRALDHQR